MSNNVGANEVVDPEVRAHVYSLVSALGGTGADEAGRYELGDDALACLKDLKRWLKLYDEKTDRLDVARCLAEANVVSGDLLEILAAWPEDATDDRVKAKVALACLELLVPLTWPIEKTELQKKVNHHRHMPYLQLAQVRYKQAILDHDTTQLLRTTVRIALPSLATPVGERTSRDEAIIRLLLYFLRNMVIITPPANLHYEGNEAEVSRSATITAFYKQDILQLLLTIGSGIGEDFNTQDVVLMEVLFHIVKGIDVAKLFEDESEENDDNSVELRDLLKKEAGMHRGYLRNAPSRHNRFGTMIWVKRNDARVSTVSGQNALMDDLRSISRIDQSKKSRNSAKRRPKDPALKQTLFDSHTPIDTSAKKILRHFVYDFLDSAFNPLFNHVRKAIEREAERVIDIHTCHFFYLVAWFLEAHRIRLRKKNEAARKAGAELESDGYSVVASVLNQETFITLNRTMDRDFESGDWNNLNASMRCFTQILLTVQDMCDSPFEDDQEIAENIQNRIFYEETTHERIVSMVRTFKNQGLAYLDAVTDLAHVHMRMLERYSKQNVDLQIRSKRRARKKKKTAQPLRDSMVDADDADSEAEEIAEAQRTSKERKFNFAQFAARFMNQSCVDTYLALTTYYQDLTLAQLKRTHRYFHRVAFKMDSAAVLYRIDAIELFNRMVDGKEAIDSTSPVYREWREFVRQLIKKLTRKLDERPELAVELLFSKSASTVFFLENGYDKETPISKPRAPAELEIKPDLTKVQGIEALVSIFVDQNKIDALHWLQGVLTSAARERGIWSAAEEAKRLTEPRDQSSETPEIPKTDGSAPSILVKADTEARKVAMFKDAKLRLLMTMCGMQRIGIEDDSEASWIITSNLSADDLWESVDLLRKAEFAPPLYDERQSAENCIQRKIFAKPRAEYDDDDDILPDDDDDLLFPAGGPTARSKTDALTELKKKRRKRTGEDKELTDKERDAKALARKEADLARRRKIKSDIYIHDSDDEDNVEKDQAFFALEEERRKKQRATVKAALLLESSKKKNSKKHSNNRKRPSNGDESSPKRAKSSPAESSADTDSEDDDPILASGESSLRNHSDPISEEEVDESNTDTPLSSPQVVPTVITGSKSSNALDLALGKDSELSDAENDDVDMKDVDLEANEEAGSVEEDVVKTVPRARRRVGVLDDSSDEE
ncbi:MAG: Topoisomerase 1-associated factor 1 [Vezdaea aestivalis]|nr:MAG: Topoisomerase 1-associated factor 1 [Vezdaea aestivalis]